jgi:glycine/D-amino acid oxidase-like deaminating enzyme
MTANLKGNAHLRQAVEEPGVACDRDPQGRYHSAATDHGVADLVGVSGALDVTGQKYRRVEAGETAEMTGSRHSLKALHHPGTILIQPAKYLKNMARKPPPNVTVHANTGDRDGRVRPRRSRVRNALGRGPREEGDPPRLGLSDPLRIFRNPAGDLG